MRQREETVKRIAYKREERKKTEEKREETREEKLWKSKKTQVKLPLGAPK